MFENVNSIGGSSLDLFECSFDISDLAFMEMIACLMDTENSLRAQMLGIRANNAEKQKWTDEVEKLNRALGESGATKDKTLIDAGVDDLKNYRDDLRTELDEKYGEFIVDLHMRELDKLSDKELKELYNKRKNEDCVDLIKLALAKRGLIQKGALTSRVETLQNRVERLNSSSQLELIDLNRLMNQYQQRVQLVSMMESKDHQTIMKLIENIR